METPRSPLPQSKNLVGSRSQTPGLTPMSLGIKLRSSLIGTRSHYYIIKYGHVAIITTIIVIIIIIIIVVVTVIVIVIITTTTTTTVIIIMIIMIIITTTTTVII